MGELYLADIGFPPEAYAEPGLELEVSDALFAGSDVVRLTWTSTPGHGNARSRRCCSGVGRRQMSIAWTRSRS